MTPTPETPIPEPSSASVVTAAAMYDPANLKEYPGISMTRFGLNPFSRPIYRLVFSSSVVHQVSYQSTGGYASDLTDATAVRSLITGQVGQNWHHTNGGSWRWEWRPKYPMIGDQWIMEKWLSAWDFHGMGRSKWERDFPNIPFFPEGVYEHCHTFEACTPVDANLDKLIAWINQGKNRSLQEIGDACRAEYDAETKATGDEIGARIRNCLPAFGTVAISGRVSRGTKTGALKRSAEEMQRRGFVVAHDEERLGALPMGVTKSKVVSSGASTEESWKVGVDL